MPLHGVPIAHKDCIFTKGVRTTWGSKLFEKFVPDRDADVVAKLEEAGAVSIGKTGLHELTYGMTSNNPWFGAVRNPVDQARVAGGSSGGSAAAVAAGIVPIATGTDTGGSIRIPASFCGVVGFKPTFDAVSRAGCFPLGFDAGSHWPAGRDGSRCGNRLSRNGRAALRRRPRPQHFGACGSGSQCRSSAESRRRSTRR